MTRLEKKLRARLRRLEISEERRVLVAVSGGADSTALLDALARLRCRSGAPKNIFAAHLNHLLRGEESDADEAFVRGMAARLEVALQVERLNVADLAQAETGNLEATARRARYEFLTRAARQFDADVIATAHTRDDQVETLMMRLLRGTGSEGLRGIYSRRMISPSLQLVRPLLELTRADVNAYCRHYGIAYRTDSTNALMDFTRNRVRHELLPAMRGFNPRFDESLLRLAERMREDDEVLHEAALSLYESARLPDAQLALKPLRSARAAIRRRVLRIWLREGRGDLRRIDAVHLLALERLILGGEGGSCIELPDGWQVWLQKGKLQLVQAGGEDQAMRGDG